MASGGAAGSQPPPVDPPAVIPGPGDPDPEVPAVADRSLRQAKGCIGESGASRVIFEIPRAGEISDDFYRLPFPSDVRRRAGKIDFAEMPRAGISLVGFDIVDRYLGALAGEGVGFGLNPTVFFRLARALAPLNGGAAVPPADSVFLVDITAGAAEYGTRIAHRAHVPARGRYFCAPGFAVEPLAGMPLLPGHRYAVLVGGALKDGQGQALSADLDFQAMLAQRAPTGDERRAAWQDHAPLRAYLADRGSPVGGLLAAAVFTTDPVELPQALRAAVHQGPAPTVTELVRCGAGRASSCDDDKAPACATLAGDPDFIEYRGRVRVPNFQRGLPPYEKDGAIARDASGKPQLVREENICFVLTTPRGAAPAAGFPIVVYSHGTGGHFRAPLGGGMAGELARGQIDGGDGVPMAFLGYEGVLHGSRKGVSTKSTEELVYNFLNPESARGNSLQAAVDLFALARALPALTPEGVKIDAGRVGLYGHSQGGNAAAVAAGFEPTFGVVVLSGTGGGLAVSLLQKSKPLPVAPLVTALLGETGTVTASHPILSLLQMYFDAGDPLNYARRIAVAPASDMTPRHLLHVFGARDSYAPEITQRQFARAGGLPVMHPVGMPEALDGAAVVAAGAVRANMGAGAGAVTAVQAQYEPGGYDGHFVSTNHADARRAILRMLGSHFRDGVPTVD